MHTAGVDCRILIGACGDAGAIEREDRGNGGRGTAPRPTLVRYNDWRQVEVAEPKAFTPTLPVSVIIPHCGGSEALSRLLASLEGQTYPRALFEVVIVDDGSPEPLERPPSTSLDVKVLQQENRGVWLTRARNAGARAADGDILVFLDSGTIVEAGCLAAHARWHHAVCDALTLGVRRRGQADGLDAETIRHRGGSWPALFAGRPMAPRGFGHDMRLADDPASRDDDLFRLVTGANFGIGRAFFDAVGGYKESFTGWGAEDIEFGYRVYTGGGLLVPARDAVAWRAGLDEQGSEARWRKAASERVLAAHLIAHPWFRRHWPGQSFTVPQYVVTIERGASGVDRVFDAAAKMLAGRTYDLVVRIEMQDSGDDAGLLEHFGGDSRVRIGSVGSALDEFPYAAFHVTLPASVGFDANLLHRLRKTMGAAVTAGATLPDGAGVSIIRTWALHRARRTGKSPADFGDVVAIAPGKLRLMLGDRPGLTARAVRAESRKRQAVPERLRAAVRTVDRPRAAWWVLKWLVRGSANRTTRWVRQCRNPLAALRRASCPPLGVELAALGPTAQAVFEASRRAVTTARGHRIDLVVADTPAHAASLEVPSVVLSEAPRYLSTPAFDPLINNPVGWVRNAQSTVGALGPPALLPPGSQADRVVRPGHRHRLRQMHHLEDVRAFHTDVTARAGVLARLAALGVVVHLADDDPRLAALLGAELHGLMAGDVRNLDPAERERASIRMRRAALREHTLRSRARQICARALPDPPRLSRVSILLATRRPARLPQALAAVARQTYPELELVLALHGEGFVDVERRVAGLACPTQVVRVDARQPLGSVLNVAAAAAGGMLLTKMDDDDLYGADHVWDLVLAHEYSQAQLVGKGLEFVYLAASDRTLHCLAGGGESYTRRLAGGALLIAREDLRRLGGWRRVPREVDKLLIEDVERAGGRVYRTHGAGFMLMRHGRRHTWGMPDDYFLTLADHIRPGWQSALADLGNLDLPHPVHG